jgi:hypothetical protein
LCSGGVSESRHWSPKNCHVGPVTPKPLITYDNSWIPAPAPKRFYLRQSIMPPYMRASASDSVAQVQTGKK